MKIEVVKAKGSNFTPSGLMLEYAKAHNIQTHRDKYGSLTLDLGFAAKYDHWEITDNLDGTETVSVFMTV